MEEVKITEPQKEYMNNTKVGRVISHYEGIIDSSDFEVLTLPRNDATTAVNLLKDENVECSKSITLFDMAVMDSIYTLYKSGMECFTFQMLYNTLTGNFEQDLPEEKRKPLLDSIEKLRHVDITINCTDELRARKKIGKKDTMVYKSYLLPISEVDIKLGNRKMIRGYKLLEMPALYAYAELLEQIVDAPTQVFRTQKRLPDSNEAVLMKRYLVQRIAAMKNNRNHMDSKKISYQWYDRKTKTEKGLYAVLGYRQEDYATKSSWSNKKKKIHNMVCKILDTMVEENYIKGYQELRDGQSLAGVEIEL